jgi:mRNA interferase MazF
VLIVQGDRFDATASVTVCPLTTNPTGVPPIRIPIEAWPLHGLDQPSRLMVDKVMTMPRSSQRERLARLSEADPVWLDRALIAFLGLAGWGEGPERSEARRQRRPLHRKLLVTNSFSHDPYSIDEFCFRFNRRTSR